MKTEFSSDFAEKLAANPSLFGMTKEDMLAELITAFINKTLPAEDAAEVAALLKSNPRAKTIHDNILAANRFLASTEGQEWLEKPLVPTESKPKAAPFQERLRAWKSELSEWMSKCFSSEALPAAAHGREPAITEPVFGSTQTNPAGGYSLTPDEQGNAWLGVTLEGAPSGALTCNITPREGEPLSRTLSLAEDKGASCALVSLNVPFTSVRDATIRFEIGAVE